MAEIEVPISECLWLHSNLDPEIARTPSNYGLEVFLGSRFLAHLQSAHCISFSLREIASLLAGNSQGHAGVRVLGHARKAALQKLGTFIDLAKIYVTKIQIVKKIWILGVLEEQLFKVDPSLVDLSGLEELKCLSEVVHR